MSREPRVEEAKSSAKITQQSPFRQNLVRSKKRRPIKEMGLLFNGFFIYVIHEGHLYSYVSSSIFISVLQVLQRGTL